MPTFTHGLCLQHAGSEGDFTSGCSTFTYALPLSTLAFLALFLIGCDSTSTSTPPAEPVASTDVGKLRQLVTLPPDVTSARWLSRPLRGVITSRAPGPTDSILFAYLELSPNFWTEHGAAFPETNGPEQRIDASDAKAVLPASVLRESTLSGDEYHLHCIRVSSESIRRSSPRTGMTLHCGTGLLLSFISD